MVTERDGDAIVAGRAQGRGDRGRTLAAETLVYGALALVVGAATLTSTVLIAHLVIAGKHLALDLSVDLVLGILVAAVLFATVVGSATAYLLYEPLGPLLRLQGSTVSRGVAALTLGGISAGLVVLAYVLLGRRDIT